MLPLLLSRARMLLTHQHCGLKSSQTLDEVSPLLPRRTQVPGEGALLPRWRRPLTLRGVFQPHPTVAIVRPLQLHLAPTLAIFAELRDEWLLPPLL